jgi:hypothetical protein
LQSASLTQEAAVDRHERHADRRRDERQLEARARAGQFGLQALALGDVAEARQQTDDRPVGVAHPPDLRLDPDEAAGRTSEAAGHARLLALAEQGLTGGADRVDVLGVDEVVDLAPHQLVVLPPEHARRGRGDPGVVGVGRRGERDDVAGLAHQHVVQLAGFGEVGERPVLDGDVPHHDERPDDLAVLDRGPVGHLERRAPQRLDLPDLGEHLARHRPPQRGLDELEGVRRERVGDEPADHLRGVEAVVGDRRADGRAVAEILVDEQDTGRRQRHQRGPDDAVVQIGARCPPFRRHRIGPSGYFVGVAECFTPCAQRTQARLGWRTPRRTRTAAKISSQTLHST